MAEAEGAVEVRSEEVGPPDERERQDEKVFAIGYRITGAPGPNKFPEVLGCCRTCKEAHITRRQYSEVPEIICMAVWNAPRRMPLDIEECTSYERRGEMDLREMGMMALDIDAREKGGQYL